MSHRPAKSHHEDAFWARPASELLSALGSSASGLSTSEAESRLARFGPNALVEHTRTGLVRLFLRQFSNPLVLILVFAAAVAAFAGEPANSIIIVIVLVGSAALTLSQEYLATTAVARLRELLHLQVPVVRDGTARDLPVDKIVPGDVVLLSAGTLVPADGVLLETRDLFVSQAVLTGESFPVEKSPGVAAVDSSLPARTNVAFMGTSVRSGTGTLLITRTGKATAFGQIAHGLSRRPPETEFARGIRRFGYMLTRIVLALVVTVFAANVFLERPPIDALLFSIALAVGISPELLPAIISVTLARGARRMAERGVIVRRLESIESLGSMDVLCCDKTGTLTEGTVHLDRAVDPEGVPSEEVFAAALTNARLQTGIRNPLDDALLSATGADGAPSPKKLDEIPYDFARRRITVVVESDDGPLLVTKGAVEELLAACTRTRGPSREERPLLGPDRKVLQERFAAWCGEGYRVLGVATRAIERRTRYAREDETNLTLEGFLLFDDRPKPGVGAVVRELHELGVRVKLITGDSVHVARHVAGAVGLSCDSVMTGTTLAETRDEALWRLVEHTDVYAEVDPVQKERIILALKQAGSVVGYMGDGVNDAPALHTADAGISVETAVDVARESADLVLLRRDLEVLRDGIRLGRTTFANTMKYIHITTSANFGNMVSMAVASFFLPFLPLLAPQILLNNFLSDIPAVALAGDEVDEAWVDRPRRWEVGPIRRFMVVFGLVSSVFDVLTFGILLFVFSAGPELFRTGWFTLSLLTELIILFVARTRRAAYRSRPSLGLILAAAGVAVVAVALPFSPLVHVFEFVRMPTSLLGVLILLTLAYGGVTEMVKQRFYRTEPGR
jgi:Mg2+-importing ATPase